MKRINITVMYNNVWYNIRSNSFRLGFSRRITSNYSGDTPPIIQGYSVSYSGLYWICSIFQSTSLFKCCTSESLWYMLVCHEYITTHFLQQCSSVSPPGGHPLSPARKRCLVKQTRAHGVRVFSPTMTIDNRRGWSVVEWI